VQKRGKISIFSSLFFLVLRKKFQVMNSQKGGGGQLKEGIIPILLSKGKV